MRFSLQTYAAMRESIGTEQPALSIVVPVLNEVDNVVPLVREIVAAFGSSIGFEVIFVDDGSTDATAERIRTLREEIPCVRLLRHAARYGQSAAIRTGVRAAEAQWIATLDGDCQNDPRDIPSMLEMLRQDRAGSIKLITGVRRLRQDTWVRRLSSRIANGVRRLLLQDGTPDTGCGIKLFHRATFLEIPAFDHMHRFLPALFLREGAKVVSIDVRHRPRMHGRSKYGIGNRLWAGIVDLFGVRWLMHRSTSHVRVLEELC
jgi:dolichol-phosphate mannosyltransferase